MRGGWLRDTWIASDFSDDVLQVRKGTVHTQVVLIVRQNQGATLQAPTYQQWYT